mmetsp:Transcript_34/g.122  ORF Transcript_34/g.122 Transcript_34/m.122 type:complete len:128 (-) Transcript_34:1208-1591(-)
MRSVTVSFGLPVFSFRFLFLSPSGMETFIGLLHLHPFDRSPSLLFHLLFPPSLPPCLLTTFSLYSRVLPTVGLFRERGEGEQAGERGERQQAGSTIHLSVGHLRCAFLQKGCIAEPRGAGMLSVFPP